MPRAQSDRCVRCNKPLSNRFACHCGVVVCSELCVRQHEKSCVECQAGQFTPPARTPRGGPSCGALVVGTALLGFAGIVLLGCIVSLAMNRTPTSRQQTPAGTTAPPATPTATHPTRPTTPTIRPVTPTPASPLTVADLTPDHDRRTVRVRGKVTEAEAATACTLDGTLSVTFATSPSPAVRAGQELTVEGTVFVVAGKVKLGRARVVE